MVYQDYSTDATIVSNMFIDHYMQDANDAQIKIYLYLLRVLGAGRACSISDLADQFNYTEKDVIRALKYWERNSLISLEYDDSKSLIGVRLLNVVEKSSTVALAPVVPIPLKSESSASAKTDTPSIPEKSATSEAKEQYIKPHYTNDDILSFKANENNQEILFVVEQYLGRPLSMAEIKSIYFFADELAFSNELIDYLFDYCLGRGKKDIKYIEKVAISWKQEGITTPKMAAKAARKYDKVVYQTMNALGRSSSPTQLEADYVTKWTNEYGYDFEIIEEACTRTVLATDSHRFEYADKILSSWFQSNVHHKSDIKKADEAFEKKKKAVSSSSNASYKQFDQREYDFDALEKEIVSN